MFGYFSFNNNIQNGLRKGFIYTKSVIDNYIGNKIFVRRVGMYPRIMNGILICFQFCHWEREILIPSWLLEMKWL